MANWHGYIGVEDVALTLPQRQAILAAFDGLGPGSGPAHHLLRRVVNPDGDRAIYEALFDDTKLTVENVKAFLANAVGVDPSVISDNTTQTAYGPLVTYTVASVDRMRFLVFGGLAATWLESAAQCIAYIDATGVEWHE